MSDTEHFQLGRPAHATSHQGAGRLLELLSTHFGFSSFRPHQEAVCRAAAEGQDLLLVMPTGAGKSLCFQLPGLARGGTTLVISPLVALIEDQVAKLQLRGLAADRVHSGRPWESCKEVMQDYDQGRLDFLFIAPERLTSPGFLAALSARKPQLIAIDEAHCISHWGHDFRPEYRMMGPRLAQLRPAPIVAVTATATPRVQEDIILQLGLKSARRFIHGFRRTNLAVEVVEVSPGARVEAALEILADPTRRPAIVYAPTRKHAESQAAALGKQFRAAAYHAGMPAEDRSEVQRSFLGGVLDIVVATIAFGMGIDKPDVRSVIHTALPATLEGYYQEIGRAGRDGAPARAILMHSFIDRRTHEFFHTKNYPDISSMKLVHRCLSTELVSQETLAKNLGIETDLVAAVLVQLRVHGGAVVSPEGLVSLGDSQWQKTYAEQRGHRQGQIVQVAHFAEATDCRMRLLVQHFGDRDHDTLACGICDACAPSQVVASHLETALAIERELEVQLLSTLRKSDSQPVGKVFRESFEPQGIERSAFEHAVGALEQRGLIELSVRDFFKNGQRIEVRRIQATPPGKRYLSEAKGQKPAATKQSAKKASLMAKPAKKQAAAKPKIQVTATAPQGSQQDLGYESVQDAIALACGAQVCHHLYGVGTIESVSTEFGSIKAVVVFPNVGKRRVATTVLTPPS